MLSRRKLLTFRARVAAGFILAGLVVTLVIGVATYFLSSSYLTRRRIDALVSQSFNNIRYAQDFLGRPEPPGPEELVGLLKTRTSGDIVFRAGANSYSSSISIAYESLPNSLTSEVEEGSVAYVHMSQPRRLLFGSPLPSTDSEIYFAYPLTELSQTLGILARIVLVVSASAIVVAGAAGLRLAGNVVRPLRRASEAAQRVAEGLIETRLHEETDDELGLLAASFNQMAEALQERIARERRFVADASHELRTPLTSLSASVEYWASHAQNLSEDLRSTAGLALDQARSLQHLLDELLDLSKMEVGSTEVREEDLLVSEFLSEAVRRRAPDHDLKVSVFPANLILRTDKMRLERIVGNLVENAVTHGRARDVTVNASVAGGVPAISVSDRGPGLRREDLPHIFEPFWRADRARRRSSGGAAGLGLAIAGESARLLGGTLEASVGDGETRFTLHLPASSVVADEEGS